MTTVDFVRVVELKFVVVSGRNTDKALRTSLAGLCKVECSIFSVGKIFLSWFIGLASLTLTFRQFTGRQSLWKMIL